MKKSKELKRMARETLNNNYSIPMGAFFVSSLITIAIEIPFSLSMGEQPNLSQYIISYLAEFLISLLAAVLSAGQFRIHLDMSRGKEVKVSQVFTCFKNHPERYIGAAFLLSVISFLCMIPAFIGTAFLYFADITTTSIIVLIVTILISMILVIYFSLTYGMVNFILLEHPQMKVLAAFHESRLLLKGNKGHYLYLNLSFIGWSLIIICTIGIASLWVQPYMTQTFTKFYLELEGVKNE